MTNLVILRHLPRVIVVQQSATIPSQISLLHTLLCTTRLHTHTRFELANYKTTSTYSNRGVTKGVPRSSPHLRFADVCFGHVSELQAWDRMITHGHSEAEKCRRAQIISLIKNRPICWFSRNDRRAVYFGPIMTE